jgi:hypothetical protein
MSTLTLAPQNILKSKQTRTKQTRRPCQAKQRATDAMDEQENIKETLKGFFEFIKGKGSYRFLPGTDLKKGIILFESSNDNITNGTVYTEDDIPPSEPIYADGESEADDDYPFYAY